MARCEEHSCSTSHTARIEEFFSIYAALYLRHALSVKKSQKKGIIAQSKAANSISVKNGFVSAAELHQAL